jgi:hypothetical protein
MFGDPVRLGRFGDREPFTPLQLCSSIHFPIDMATVCSVRPTLLGCHSTAPSCNLLYGYGVQFGFLGRDVNTVLNVTFSGLLAVGSVAISYIQRARPGTNIFTVAKAWITAYFSMTMSSNVICSGEPTLAFHRYSSCVFLTYVIGTIATRIYLAWKSQSRGNQRLYRRIVFIIVESSALYALGVLAALVSFVSGTNGQYAAVDAIVPLVVSPTPFLYPSFFSRL